MTLYILYDKLFGGLRGKNRDVPTVVGSGQDSDKIAALNQN